MRIISFLPAATEMAYALGLGPQLLGVTHECDFPSPARNKPIVVRNALPLEKMTTREIDLAVSECVGSGRSLYQVDEHLLERLAPTHILTQALCQVCAPSGNEITRVLNALHPGLAASHSPGTSPPSISVRIDHNCAARTSENGKCPMRKCDALPMRRVFIRARICGDDFAGRGHAGSPGSGGASPYPERRTRL